MKKETTITKVSVYEVQQIKSNVAIGVPAFLADDATAKRVFSKMANSKESNYLSQFTKWLQVSKIAEFNPLTKEFTNVGNKILWKVEDLLKKPKPKKHDHGKNDHGKNDHGKNDQTKGKN